MPEPVHGGVAARMTSRTWTAVTAVRDVRPGSSAAITE